MQRAALRHQKPKKNMVRAITKFLYTTYLRTPRASAVPTYPAGQCRPSACAGCADGRAPIAPVRARARARGRGRSAWFGTGSLDGRAHAHVVPVAVHEQQPFVERKLRDRKVRRVRRLQQLQHTRSARATSTIRAATRTAQYGAVPCQPGLRAGFPAAPPCPEMPTPKCASCGATIATARRRSAARCKHNPTYTMHERNNQTWIMPTSFAPSPIASVTGVGCMPSRTIRTTCEPQRWPRPS